MTDRSGSSTVDDSGRQVFRIEVASGYHPAIVAVRPNVSIRLVFHRLDDDPCTERVVFSAPRIERRLSPDHDTVVDLPPRPPGDIRFTCGMGRYSGIVRVTEPADGLAWLRNRAPGAISALTVAIVVAIVGLPIITVLALVFLDAPPSSLVAIVAAIVALGGVLWLLATDPLRRAPDHWRRQRAPTRADGRTAHSTTSAEGERRS
jgi:hypothetical protein